METPTSSVDIERTHSRLLNLGLLMNVFAPVVLIFVGAVVKARGVNVGAVSDLGLFFWILIAVAFSEIPAIYIVKRSFLSGSRAFQKNRGRSTTEQALLRKGIIIFSLALAPTVYGLVYYLLGGTLERFVLFAAITLFCFVVFKPKQEEISSLMKRQIDAQENSTEV